MQYNKKKCYKIEKLLISTIEVNIILAKKLKKKNKNIIQLECYT